MINFIEQWYASILWWYTKRGIMKRFKQNSTLEISNLKVFLVKVNSKGRLAQELKQLIQELENKSTYDMSIHSNPDAMAWAKFYKETFPKADLDTIHGWFANAMMAMHDNIYQTKNVIDKEVKQIPYCIDIFQECKGETLLVPEIRVWSHSKEGSDYYDVFSTFLEAMDFISKHEEAEDVPLIAFAGKEINIYDLLT